VQNRGERFKSQIYAASAMVFMRRLVVLYKFLPMESLVENRRTSLCTGKQLASSSPSHHSRSRFPEPSQPTVWSPRLIAVALPESVNNELGTRNYLCKSE
jgi:hypothetical protein